MMKVKTDSYKKFARIMDWILAWASIPFTVGMFLWYYPEPNVWCWVSVVMIPISFVLAYVDWQEAFSVWLHTFLIHRRG